MKPQYLFVPIALLACSVDCLAIDGAQAKALTRSFVTSIDASATDKDLEVIDNGRIHTRVDNDHLGLDPDPHVHKVLRILYWYQGERRNIVVPEHNVLDLP